MISSLRRIFGSYSKAQEMLFLLHGLKAVVRQGFYGEEMPAVEGFCKSHSLFLVKSRFKVILDGEKNFTNKGWRIPETEPRAGMYNEGHCPLSNVLRNIPEDKTISINYFCPPLYFVYISQDEEKAYLASYYELTNNHRGLGLLLGYPACCVDYFCRNFSEQNTNPEILSVNSSGFPENWYTNLSRRHEDYVIISHFPCRADCAESITLGKSFFALLQQKEPERAKELWESLSA